MSLYFSGDRKKDHVHLGSTFGGLTLRNAKYWQGSLKLGFENVSCHFTALTKRELAIFII